MKANPESVIQSEPPAGFPLILRVPLQKFDLEIRVRPRAGLAVAVEVASKRVSIGVSRISQRGREAAAAAEVECPGPVPACGFSIYQALEIQACLISMVAAIDR